MKKISKELIALGDSEPSLRPHLRPVIATIEKLANRADAKKAIYRGQSLQIQHIYYDGVSVSDLSREAKALEEAAKKLQKEMGYGKIEDMHVSGEGGAVVFNVFLDQGLRDEPWEDDKALKAMGYVLS